MAFSGWWWTDLWHWPDSLYSIASREEGGREVCSSVRLPIHLLTQSPTQSPTHPDVHPPTHPLTPFTHLSVHQLMYPSTNPTPMYLFTHPFIYPSAHPLTFQLTPSTYLSTHLLIQCLCTYLSIHPGTLLRSRVSQREAHSVGQTCSHHMRLQE